MSGAVTFAQTSLVKCYGNGWQPGIVLSYARQATGINIAPCPSRFKIHFNTLLSNTIVEVELISTEAFTGPVSLAN